MRSPWEYPQSFRRTKLHTGYTRVERPYLMFWRFSILGEEMAANCVAVLADHAFRSRTSMAGKMATVYYANITLR